jgi:hypothetical protein
MRAIAETGTSSRRSWAATARKRAAWIRTSPVWKHSNRPPRAERTTSASSLPARRARALGDAIRQARAAVAPSAAPIGAAISIASRTSSRSRRAPRAALPASAAAPVAMTAAQSQNAPSAGSSLPATALAQASTSSTHASSQRAASASSVQASRSRVGTVLLMASR